MKAEPEGTISSPADVFVLPPLSEVILSILRLHVFGE